MLYVPFPFKRCTKCDQWFPFTSFGKKSNTPDKLRCWCKTCHRLHTHRDPIRRKEYEKQYRSDHRDERTAYNREYYRKYKDTPIGAERRAKRAPYLKQYHINHREQKIEAAQRHYRANINKKRDYDSQYRQKRRFDNRVHQMKIANWHRYKAKKQELPAQFSAQDWNICLNWWNSRCAYCGNPPGLFSGMEMNADHFIALTDPNCPGTVRTNILPACKSCNCSKSNSKPQDWIINKFDPRKAKQILKRIMAYFASVASDE